jgi:hypothetical protein
VKEDFVRFPAEQKPDLRRASVVQSDSVLEIHANPVTKD